MNDNKPQKYVNTLIWTSILLLASTSTATSQLRGHRGLMTKNQTHTFENRIVGGDDAREGEFKFMVIWDASCGGSLIHDELVLTAAHCGFLTGGVRIGSLFMNRGGVSRSVVRKVGHPGYNDATTANDYMILKLNEPVDISVYQPIKLNDNANVPPTNEMLTVIGFGATSEGGSGSNKLQKVAVPTNSNQQCQSQYSGIDERIHLCAGFQQGGKDSCQGDSGGPIFRTQGGKRVQVGVVSFGEGCARPNNSGVYARVSGAYDWIQSQICALATLNRPSSCGPAPPPSSPVSPPTNPSPTVIPPSATAPSAQTPSAQTPSAPAPSAQTPSGLAPSGLAPSAFAPSALAPSAPTTSGDDTPFNDDFPGDDNNGGLDDDNSGGFDDDNSEGFDDDNSGGFHDDNSQFDDNLTGDDGFFDDNASQLDNFFNGSDDFQFDDDSGDGDNGYQFGSDDNLSSNNDFWW